MKNEKISIIIPVYNTEKFLNECIQSVINQTYKNIEIILVNDGSIDSSLMICEKYAESDKRIKIINQKNKGVSVARKKGLEVATGNYVGFVDSDDYVAPQMFESLLDTEVDLVCSGCIKVYGEKNKIYCHDAIENGKYDNSSKMEYVLSNMIYMEGSYRQGIKGYLFCKLFRTNILKQVMNEMNTDIYFAEDEAIVYSYLLYCSSVKVVYESYYYYRMREDSAIHRKDKYFFKNINDYYVYLEDCFSKHSMKEKLLNQLEKHMVFWIKYGLQNKLNFRSQKLNHYIFDDEEKLKDKKVAIYGGGSVGKSYYNRYSKTEFCKVVLWVDKFLHSDNTDIEEISRLKEIPFDVLLVAVKSEQLAEEIIDELLEMGITKEKILWHPPKEDFNL